MSGITKIRIDSDFSKRRGGWRLRLESGLSGVANEIYRDVFDSIGMRLADGYGEIGCTKSEAMSRYDWKEGIDVIFLTASGIKMTAQEKFLTYHTSTATFEEKKSSGEPGAWYYCTAQYYFVGYAREWKTGGMVNGRWRDDPESSWPKRKKFHDWILIDLPMLHRADAKGLVNWRFNHNTKDGRRASFRYIEFNRLPDSCIVASKSKKPQIELPF